MLNNQNKDKDDYYFVFDGNKLLVINMDDQISIPTAKDLIDMELNLNQGRYFGTLNGNGCYCTNKSKDYTPASNMSFQELRSLGIIFNEELFHLSCRGLHLLRWYENNIYCNKCGALTEDKEDENARICPNCGNINYPRLSPAIIVAIINEDKLLLAHNSRFINGNYSVIAGFVEPGETFEECVSREVREEVGIKVKNIKYFGSEPWPFPDSLMVGFTAEYADGEIREDGIEIDHAGWFRADELPKTPTGKSIAGKLIKWFVDNYSNMKKEAF